MAKAEAAKGPLDVIRSDGALTLRERAERALDMHGRRQSNARLCHDVDDPADRAVAVQHGPAVAARDLDALDARARDRGEVHAGEIDVG